MMLAGHISAITIWRVQAGGFHTVTTPVAR